MMAREVIEVIESMLSQSKELLCLAGLKEGRMDGNFERKDWSTGLDGSAADD